MLRSPQSVEGFLDRREPIRELLVDLRKILGHTHHLYCTSLSGGGIWNPLDSSTWETPSTRRSDSTFLESMDPARTPRSSIFCSTSIPAASTPLTTSENRSR